MRHYGSLLSLPLLLVACSSPPERVDDGMEQDTDVAGDAGMQPVADDSAPASRRASQDPGQVLLQDRQDLELRQQRTAFFVERHIENAARLRDQLRLEDAREELLAAQRLDGDNLQVKRMLAEVQTMLGESAGQVQTVTEDMSNMYQLRTEQMRAEARESVRRGEDALARGDHSAAIAEFTIALNHVRYAPFAIDWQGLDTRAESLLQRARSDRRAAEEQSQLDAQRQAYEALQAQRDAERQRDQAVVENMIAQAIDAFQAGRYDVAMDYADQALRRDPRNGRALDLRESSFRAGRESAKSRYVESKREQFLRWREELDELKIPYVDPVTLTDPDRWAEISKRSARLADSLGADAESASDVELRRLLRTTTMVLPRMNAEESLRRVVDPIRLFTGLPIVVDPAAENAMIDDGRAIDLTLEAQLTVEQLLNLITAQAGEEVTWTIRHDAVLVTTREKARGNPVVKHHDVQDLVFGLTDFIGPRIDRIRLLDELEDDDGGGPFGAIGEVMQVLSPDDLATLIQENVAVGTWDDFASIESFEGNIIIVHTPEVQEKVSQFLEGLRRFSSSLVTIESKFMTVAENWIQEIGVDIRGLDQNPLTDVTNGLENMASRGLDNGGTGADGPNAAGAPSSGFFYDEGSRGDLRGRTENFFGSPLGNTLSTIGGMTAQWTLLDDLQLSMILRAVEKSNKFQVINNQVLSVHNTQRAYVTVIQQRAYIQDFDVEVAQFQAVADPQVNVLHEGVVLDVRPTIHHDRRYIRLEIQPTVAKVVALRDFSSTLGGNTSPVSFQLPEIEVQSVRTTADIPDGGSVMLGGLSNIRNVERRAEVPWLARVPIVGFFFKTEGYNDENRSLMILIRARITDVREEAAKLEARY